MPYALLDRQFLNLFVRAVRDPYFDFECALCLAMESSMRQRLATMEAFTSLAKGRQGGILSFAKIFAWPSEELCACLHKFDSDHLYIFDASESNLTFIESTEPMLYPIEQGDRIVILNDWAGKYIDEQTLEQLLSRHSNDSNESIEQELAMCAYVNARGNVSVLPEFFVVSTMRA